MGDVLIYDGHEYTGIVISKERDGPFGCWKYTGTLVNRNTGSWNRELFSKLEISNLVMKIQELKIPEGFEFIPDGETIYNTFSRRVHIDGQGIHQVGHVSDDELARLAEAALPGQF